MPKDFKKPLVPATSSPSEAALADQEAIPDACPIWADRLIREMLALEIRLGNIQPHEDEGDEWHTDQLEQLQQRLETRQTMGTVDEAATESLFKRIVSGLHQEGFTEEQITSWINARMLGKSRLPYCNSDEVKEALRIPIQ